MSESAYLQGLRRQLAEAETREKAQIGYGRPEAELSAMRAEQAKADNAYMDLGRQAPPPVEGETAPAYQRRLVSGLQRYSPKWAAVNLVAAPEAALPVIAEEVYADAAREARNPKSVPPGELREVKRPNDAGAIVSEFYGSPSTWMQDFMGPRHRAKFTSTATPAVR